MELFNFLKKLHDECIDLSRSIKFDKQHPRHLHLIGLYGSIIELSGCLITLIEKKMWTGVPTIFRSILEAFVDLRNLQATAEYGYYMQASYHSQWLKLIKEAKKGNNPFLSKVAQSRKLDSEISGHEKELSALKAKGYKPLFVIDRFKKAGLINEYKSIYNSLSNDAHSNISALIDRHYEIEGDNFRVVYYKDKPIEDTVTYIDSTAGVLVNSTGLVHEYFRTDSIGKVKDIEKSFHIVREQEYRVDKSGSQ
jgi:hypothetical protein